MNRPNIITIIADDMGSWACGKKAGNEEIIVPNLEVLANDGTFFDNFYCVSPVCSPARASIYSGSIPSNHGVFDWIASGNLDKKDLGDLSDAPEFAKEEKTISFMERITTYSEIMNEHGYRCSLSGKWHLGDSLRPQAGYSDWYTLGRGGCEYIKADIVDNGKIEFKEGYVTDMITDRALEYIDSFKDGKPHYVNVTYTAPHSPWGYEQHPQKYRDLYKECPFQSTPDVGHHPFQIASAPVPTNQEERREYLTGYYASISAIDDGVGKIISKLKEIGEYENTLIIFTSDNGMNMGHHGIWGKGNGTYPLNMFESSVKVPMIISWPNRLPKNNISFTHRSHYDIFPTLMDYLNIDKKYFENLRLPGESLRNVFENKEDDYITVIYDEYGATRMIRDTRYKLVKRFAYGPDEFYDLTTDPNEDDNLIDSEKHQQIIGDMYRKMIHWFNKYSDENLDGTREAVGGSGQLKLAGIYGDGQNVYRPRKEPLKFD
ncbi:sulfatase-like hydrolase/transferase [Tannockella kyphosi]|uniref:sulfatase-like hydrolase/transferase n=1 Tax=Tannockella kyphosi TaxID=2899121 RepID=UPI0020138DDE|nr:sulfatase-like hydrolase/transferase [Tannockella kyphosi]